MISVSTVSQRLDCVFKLPTLFIDLGERFAEIVHEKVKCMSAIFYAIFLGLETPVSPCL